MANPENPILDHDACFHFLASNTFKLRPADYALQYPRWPGAVGLELESLVVFTDDLKSQNPRQIRLFGPQSLSTALIDVAARQGWHSEEASAEDTGLARPQLMAVGLDHNDKLTFEPGAQLEFSSFPYPCFADSLNRLDDILAKLNRGLAAHHLTMVQHGINPWQTVDEIGLQMPKRRYRAMDKYFRAIGEFGPRMMRQTCTVQVNLDFGSSEDLLVKRYLAANLLSPFATAAFANSPIVDGRDTGLQSFRSRVWRGVDPARTGIPDISAIVRKPTKKACVESYLNFALAAPVIFVEELDYEVPNRPMTFKQWLTDGYKGIFPRLTDLETHLSLLFAEVRPRGFLELRSLDAQILPWVPVAAVFYIALLYDDDCLNKTLDLILEKLPRMSDLLTKAAHGLADTEIRQTVGKLFDLVEAGTSRFSECFQRRELKQRVAAFREKFTDRGLTPADYLRSELGKKNLVTPTPELLLFAGGQVG